MEFLFVAALIGFIPASIAKNKGHSFGTWWFYGFLLFIVALPHSLLLKPRADGIERAEQAAGKRRCPQCAEFIQAAANLCRYCGSPTTAVSATVPAVPTLKKQRPVGHIGTVPGCLLILLATMGVTAVVSRTSSPDRPPQQQAPARRTPARKPTPPPPSFDAQRAAQGKELHARLLAESNVHEFYLSGSLFGAVTSDPKASIAVPMGAWTTLGDDERAELMHYAASLIEPMRKDPLVYCQIPASAPAAGMVRENASKMGPRSWVIHGGRLDGRDILTDEAVASGADHLLGPRRDIAPPEEVISQLGAVGLRADSPWRRSNFDGIWNAVLRATFSDNEVSCLLESKSPGTVEVVELEAEIHRPGQREEELFRAFASAAKVLCGEPGLADAIEARADWSAGKWKLAREPHATGGDYGLMLQYR